MTVTMMSRVNSRISTVGMMDLMSSKMILITWEQEFSFCRNFTWKVTPLSSSMVPRLCLLWPENMEPCKRRLHISPPHHPVASTWYLPHFYLSIVIALHHPGVALDISQCQVGCGVHRRESAIQWTGLGTILHITEHYPLKMVNTNIYWVNSASHYIFALFLF